MEKKEFFDNIETIRQMVDGVGDTFNASVDDILILLDSLKTDANLLIEDEYQSGYNLGLNHGWNHLDPDSY